MHVSVDSTQQNPLLNFDKNHFKKNFSYEGSDLSEALKEDWEADRQDTDEKWETVKEYKMQDISSFIHQLDKYMEAHHGESRMKIEENKYNDTEIFPKPVSLRTK